jgi:eukaryotic-like serine/threonine-protein kinase
MAEPKPGDIFKPGDLLNNTYRIESVLGRGGTSEVYKARNEISGRFVAIKALKSEFSGDEGYLTLMRREEEIREIRHDAVVRYSENHRTPDGHIYLVMDYVQGPDLNALLRAGGLPASDLLAVCTRVAQGLRVAHGRNIVHRDLSPDNIILRDGKPDQAVIIDFGIAKDTNPGAETIVGNEFAGKYAYAAPEQLSGNTDARSDIYSLGALLLATFRGAKPDIGNNPMEVLKRKGEPLPTEGVPEPLKSVIDRMTRPLAAERFQSADQLLAALGASDTSERTVIAPRPAAAQEKPKVAPKVEVRKPTSNRSGLWVALGVLLVLGAGAGGYFGGYLDQFMTPPLPVADPYSLIVERTEAGVVRAVGYMPSPEAAEAMSRTVAGLGGTSELTVATGEIAPTWADDVLGVVQTLKDIEVWRLAVNGNEARVTGVTLNRDKRAAVTAAFADGLPGGLIGNADILQGPLILSQSMLNPLLEEFGDCGPLALQDPPALGYGTDATVTVTGRLATTEARVAMSDALRAMAGDRDVVLDVEMLNPALCLIEANLPDVAPAGVSVVYSFADRPDPNPSGRYFVGENPVIDVILPADMVDGYVSVSLLDVSGNVYHLLPNVNRPQNDVAVLRAGATGPFSLRAVFPKSSTDGAEISFVVDASSLGKTKVIVIHSTAPLFAEFRPTTESAGGYAEALHRLAETGGLSVTSLDSSILTTVER